MVFPFETMVPVFTSSRIVYEKRNLSAWWHRFFGEQVIAKWNDDCAPLSKEKKQSPNLTPLCLMVYRPFTDGLLLPSVKGLSSFDSHAMQKHRRLLSRF